MGVGGYMGGFCFIEGYFLGRMFLRRGCTSAVFFLEGHGCLDTGCFFGFSSVNGRCVSGYFLRQVATLRGLYF